MLQEKTTFDTIEAKSRPITMLNKTQIVHNQNSTQSVPLLNSLSFNGYYFEDSDGFIFQTTDLFYTRRAITEDISLGVDAGVFSFERKNLVKYSGVRYGATLLYKHLSLRLGMNQYDNFSELVPTLLYKDSYKKHQYSLEYTRQNALFYTYAIKPYEKRIVADHFSLTDFVTFDRKSDLWANLEYNSYSNSDTEITAQFDYVFDKRSAFTPNFTYNLAVEGWYTSHSKQHNDFYSPDFADATLLRVDPRYIFSKYFGLRGKLGAGYSVSDEDTPYKYGLWAFGEPMSDMYYSVGCLESNAARLANGPNYHYIECNADLGYSW